MKENNIKILHNGNELLYWNNFKLQKQLNSIADVLSISICAKDFNNYIDYKYKIIALIDNNEMFTGYIDNISMSENYKNESIDFKITARSITSDFIDSKITCQYTQMPIISILEDAAKKFGFILDNQTSGESNKININCDCENLFEKLKEPLKLTNYVFISSNNKLILKNYDDTKLIINILTQKHIFSYDYKKNYNTLFGQYKLVYKNSNKVAINDKRIRQSRILNFKVDDSVASALDRINFEKNDRIKESETITIVALGFYNPDKTIWDINSKVKIQLDSINFSKQLLLIGCEFSMSTSDGTRTQLKFTTK